MVLHRKGWAISFGISLVVGLTVWLGLPSWQPYVWHGFATQPSKPATDFTLAPR